MPESYSEGIRLRKTIPAKLAKSFANQFRQSVSLFNFAKLLRITDLDISACLNSEEQSSALVNPNSRIPNYLKFPWRLG